MAAQRLDDQVAKVQERVSTQTIHFCSVELISLLGRHDSMDSQLAENDYSRRYRSTGTSIHFRISLSDAYGTYFAINLWTDQPNVSAAYILHIVQFV